MQTRIHHTSIKGTVCRAAALTATWGLFTGWSLWSWVIGVPAILAALLLPRFVPPLPSFTVRPVAALRFFVHFSAQSVLGGIDVAWRAFHPRCPLAPGLVHYPLRLHNGFAAMFFANSISLLPGTLSVDLQDRQVIVHTLDRNQNVQASLRLLESRVGKVFGEDIAHD